jgi:hypothetical protein
MDYAALMAATTALEATTAASRSSAANDQHRLTYQNGDSSSAATNGTMESGLGNSPKSINLSRQNSTRMSNMSDSAYGEDSYESSSSPNGHTKMHRIQKSSSMKTGPGPQVKITEVIKHSKSYGKLERKVSFSEADPVKIGELQQAVDLETTTAEPPTPQKPKRTKEKPQKERNKEKKLSTGSLKKEKKEKKPTSPTSIDFVDQVSAKLRVLEQQQQAEDVVTIRDVDQTRFPNSFDVSATVVLSSPKTIRQQMKAATVSGQQQQQKNSGQLIYQSDHYYISA